MMPGRPGEDQRGLTLIELVLALTIVAVAGALVSGAFTTGLRAWQSGVRSGREEFVVRVVLERMAAQLRATVETMVEEDHEDVVAFDAGEDFVRFVTLAVGAAPTHVSYGLTGEGDARHLVYREYPWPEKEFFGAERARREEEVPEITGLKVTAVERSAVGVGQTGDPAADWTAPNEFLPASVTIAIEVGGEGELPPRVYEITVPVLAGEGP